MFGSDGAILASRPEKAFTEVGFRDWKHAMGKDGILKGHSDSLHHKQAVVAWKQFNKVETSIVDHMGGNRQEQLQKNRHYIKTLCEILLLCSNQGIAFRGHREDEASKNKGNFIEILQLVANHDEVVRNRLSILPKNAMYTSAQIQNELLDIMAEMVRDSITSEVQNAGVFSILADESKDISKQEQLVLILRYVHKETCTVHERFLTYVKAESFNAESLSAYIIKTLQKYKLDPSSLVSQGYDGASVMSGSCTGVQQRIKAHAPNAIYIHCYAHCLNLALVDCVRNVQDACEFFALMELLYVFMSSAKVHVLYVAKQKELHPSKKIRELQRLCDTRWACRYFAVDAVCSTYDSVIGTLEDISNGEDKAKVVEAKGILAQVKGFKFLLLLIIFTRILSFTKSLSDQLQSATNDMAKAAGLITSTIETLQEFRSDSAWNHLYKYTQDVAKLNDIPTTVTTRPSRSKQPPKHLGDGIVMQSIGSREALDCRESFKVSLYFCILDSMLGELRRRFESKNLKIMKAIQACNPQSTNFLKYEEIYPLALAYGVDTNLLVQECYLAKQTFKDTDLDNINACLKEVCTLDAAFPALKKVLQIALTIVVSTASCEQSFSSLRRIKSYLRSTMSEERLVNLATLSTEKDLTKKICLNKVIDLFNGLDDNRRIMLS